MKKHVSEIIYVVFILIIILLVFTHGNQVKNYDCENTKPKREQLVTGSIAADSSGHYWTTQIIKEHHPKCDHKDHKK